MKRVLSSILISFIVLANLFAPISVGVNKSGVEVKTQSVEAVSKSLAEERAKKAADEARQKILDEGGTAEVAMAEWVKVHDEVYNKEYTGVTTDERLESLQSEVDKYNKLLDDAKKENNQTGIEAATLGLKVAQRNLDYFKENGETYGGDVDQDGVVVQNSTNPNTNNSTSNMPACSLNPFWDGGGTVMGCIAQGFYYVLFVPTSYLFALSGVFFDSTFAYSVQDTSYRSSFVVEGWGLVRDFCNMFFIFILLYVAIGTTLSLHGFKTKETIINVIIIGLVINFSLFATQLIIDASNITARVFYNADTIKITEKGVDGATTVISEVGEGGVIPLSAALVNKVNPQNLILQSKAINNIPDRGGASTTDKQGADNLDAGSFILIVIIASAVNIVGFIVFLSVGMMFVARVIGLWLAMIIAPLAFFTYILPDSMAGIKMIGWKNWWPETFKLAFLAPVFIFFMYLILKFLEMDLISDSAGRSVTDVQSGLNYFVATLIPFAFIMILMMKAKSIASDMSGEFGQTLSKFGSSVGGMVLGGAVGVGAMAMRGTVGKLGNSLANSNTVKGWERRGYLGASQLRNIGKAAGSGSFDIRGTKIGASAGKGLGADLGKAKEGGFVKARAENVAYRQNRVKELEVGEDTQLTQNVRNAEHALHAIKTDPDRQNLLLTLNNGDANAPQGSVANMGVGGLERAVATGNRAVEVAERALKDAVDAMAAIPATVPLNDPTRIAAQGEINRLRANRDSQINGGNVIDANGVTTVVAIGRDQAKNNLEARQQAIRDQERDMHIAEDNLARFKNEVIRENNQVRHDYAHSIQGAWSNTISGILSLNEHSVLGEREAAHKILAGVEEDKKIADHH